MRPSAGDLTDRESHFGFGDNWRDYARTVDVGKIEAARVGMQKLLPDEISGKTFLDIGSGSGIHSLAALSLGAKHVSTIDIDAASVATTRQMLREHPKDSWAADVRSVFDLSPEETFEVVYSWGVLHHTGDLWRAVESAASVVKPGGLFCISIYCSTRFDNFWIAEKRFYSRSPRPVQWLIGLAYKAAFLASQVWFGKNPIALIREYSGDRGMNFSHDVHDWLGGYPYEPASPDEIRKKLASLGFEEVRAFLLPTSSGLFGSGCNEFVFRRL
jgi:SAM-dependent methyltransferase